MLVLALDTTTRAGSVALVRDTTVLAAEAGDAHRTHGERLPHDIIRILEQHDVRLAAIDLFAVAAGPGSFTGLRIGIATMQGLAFANGKGLVGVSTLDALALAAAQHRAQETHGGSGTIAVWMDARRHEVFAALYAVGNLACLDGPAVAPPQEILERWSRWGHGEPTWFVGDGALAYRSILTTLTTRPTHTGRIVVIDPTPLAAPAIAAIAAREAAAGAVCAPHAVRPLYVRRPDAELARDRMKARVDP